MSKCYDCAVFVDETQALDIDLTAPVRLADFEKAETDLSQVQGKDSSASTAAIC